MKLKKSELEKRVSKLLDEEETFMLSIILLAHMHSDKKYKELSDLIFLFDNYKGFKQFIKYYEGQTISVPTILELKQSLRLLTFFQKVYLDNRNPEEVYKELDLASIQLSLDYCMQQCSSFKELLKNDGTSTLAKVRRLSKKFNGM